MAAHPPIDFATYQEWRRTQPGLEWFREQLFRHHVLYVCDQCGDRLWMTQGDGLADEMLCPWPCGGTRRMQRKPQFWEEDGDAE